MPVSVVVFFVAVTMPRHDTVRHLILQELVSNASPKGDDYA